MLKTQFFPNNNNYTTNKPTYSLTPKRVNLSLKKDTVSFKGHVDNEFIKNDYNKCLRHETAFFRDAETNKFIQNYVLENFSKKDKIKMVIAGCSTGEEVITQSILFDDIKDKIDIIGFDLSKSVIDKANSRKYILQKPIKAPEGYIDIWSNLGTSGFNDAYLVFPQDTILTKEQKKNKELFNEFFEITNDKVENQTLTLKQKLDNWIMKNCLKVWPLQLENKTCKLKDDKALNCKFVQGDILKLKAVIKGEKADIILFRNALYHLITEDLEYSGSRRIKPNATEILTNLATQIKENLNNNGIFVLGENEAIQLLNDEIVCSVFEEQGLIPLNETKEHSANVWQYPKNMPC